MRSPDPSSPELSVPRLVGAPASLRLRLLAFFVAGYLALTYMPGKVVELPGASWTSSAFSTLLPESWGFFTKDPTEERYLMLVVTGDDIVPIDSDSQADLGNLFGLSREPRLRQSERYGIASVVPDERWIECADTSQVVACASDLIEGHRSTGAFEVSGRSEIQFHCGEYIVVQRSALPWAWRHTPSDFRLRVAWIEVTCS
jgi:antimicrobial peptide system SdpA family protein